MEQHENLEILLTIGFSLDKTMDIVRDFESISVQCTMRFYFHFV